MKENPELLNNQAVQFAQQGSYTEAIACFMRAISIQRNNAGLWYNLGITYRDSGYMKHAKMALSRALQLEPYDETTLEAIAELCFQSNQFEESVGYCMNGLDVNPCNAHLWNTVGASYFNLGEYEDASEAFEQALAINPYYFDALYNLRDTYTELHNKAGAHICQQRLNELHGGKRVL